ncbi:MAG: TerC family protein [Caldilineaceae bacterium]|nr:TerC family protein [Caldilineaceae bacterium]
MDALFSVDNLIALFTLLALEIVLGIDNVIFIAILSGKLPVEQQARARTTGIALAVITRILLLLGITWIMSLQAEIINIFDNGLSGRDLILLAGGLFLIGKSTYEIHEKLEADDHDRTTKVVASFAAVIVQIVLVDLVFSLDSVITAVGISNALWVMVTAIIIAAGVMLTFAGAISAFVERHPTMKVLALAFLILIGSMLVIEGWNSEIAHELHLKNYIYFAMAFSFIVEMVNLRLRTQKAAPVQLHNQPTLDHAATVPASGGSALAAGSSQGTTSRSGTAAGARRTTKSKPSQRRKKR